MHRRADASTVASINAIGAKQPPGRYTGYLASVGDRLAAATSLADKTFDLFLEQHPGSIPVLWRPFDWVRDALGDLSAQARGRQFPPIVGYGRGRPLFDGPTERQLRAEDQLRHRRIVQRIDYTPAEHFTVATLTCGHMVRLDGHGRPLRMVGTLLPCPECAA